MAASLARIASPDTSRKFSFMLTSESADHDPLPGAISAPVVAVGLV
jgi:hypothetical protein